MIKPWRDKPTPALALRDLEGRPVDLSSHRGRVLVLNFWATWCEPCRDEMPSLKRLKTKMGERPLDVLLVNYGEGMPRVRQFLQREPLGLPIVMDPDKVAAGDWGVGGLPMTFIVDARGQVRYSVFGERDWSEGETLALVQQLVEEAPGAGR